MFMSDTSLRADHDRHDRPDLIVASNAAGAQHIFSHMEQILNLQELDNAGARRDAAT